MAVKVDIEKCTGCWKCIDVCPNSSLEQANNGTKDHVKVKEDDCIDCYLCVEECKFGALQQPD
ncbi:MAG: 4Fe-4S binding protein [Phycisphaerales bacterium]|nr:4Fe-4S binding protein [Phycisphaerales bacterium]